MEEPKYCQCKYPLTRVDPFNKEYCGKCDRYFEEIKIRKMKQIKPQELSPNMSYVRYNGMILKVTSVEHPMPRVDRFNDKWIITLFCDGFITCTINEIEPVELTEEILLRLGFTKEGNSFFYKEEKFQLVYENKKYGYWDEFTEVYIPYLHTLQNFIFTNVEGEELELKPKQ